MKRVAFLAAVGALVAPTSQPAMAQPSLHISIPLPPPLRLPAPPSVVVLPETRVYVVPELVDDLFFFDGWWWRPWGGRWYRSQYYDRGWVHYGGVPSFYRGIPRGWRDDYHRHRWGAGAWNPRPIHHDELHRNWREWRDLRHWDQPPHRQYETRRDGRPFAPAPPAVRRPEPRREGHLRPAPETHRPPGREARPHGRDDRGGREPGRPGPEHREGPRRDRH